MSFMIAGFEFEGPFRDAADLQDAPGVYVVVSGEGVLDVGQSSEIRTRVEGHDRDLCWDLNAVGAVAYGAHHMPEAGDLARIDVEQRVRAATNPPCGDR